MSDVRPRVFTATSKALGPKAQNLKNDVEAETNIDKEVKIPSLEGQAVGAQLEQQIMSDLTTQAGTTRDPAIKQGIAGVISGMPNIVPQGVNILGTQTGLGAQQFTPVIGAQPGLTQQFMRPGETLAQEVQTTIIPTKTIVEQTQTTVPQQTIVEQTQPNVPMETIVEERQTNVPTETIVEERQTNLPGETIVEERQTNLPGETIVEQTNVPMQNIPITERVNQPIGTTVLPGGVGAFNQSFQNQPGVTNITSSSQGLPIDQVIRQKQQEGEQMIRQDMQNLQAQDNMQNLQAQRKY